MSKGKQMINHYSITHWKLYMPVYYQTFCDYSSVKGDRTVGPLTCELQKKAINFKMIGRFPRTITFPGCVHKI